jgi:hypothetical protein
LLTQEFRGFLEKNTETPELKIYGVLANPIYSSFEQLESAEFVLFLDLNQPRQKRWGVGRTRNLTIILKILQNIYLASVFSGYNHIFYLAIVDGCYTDPEESF